MKSAHTHAEHLEEVAQNYVLLDDLRDVWKRSATTVYKDLARLAKRTTIERDGVYLVRSGCRVEEQCTLRDKSASRQIDVEKLLASLTPEMRPSNPFSLGAPIDAEHSRSASHGNGNGTGKDTRAWRSPSFSLRLSSVGSGRHPHHERRSSQAMFMRRLSAFRRRHPSAPSSPINRRPLSPSQTHSVLPSENFSHAEASGGQGAGALASVTMRHSRTRKLKNMFSSKPAAAFDAYGGLTDSKPPLRSASTLNFRASTPLALVAASDAASAAAARRRRNVRSRSSSQGQIKSRSELFATPASRANRRRRVFSTGGGAALREKERPVPPKVTSTKRSLSAKSLSTPPRTALSPHTSPAISPLPSRSKAHTFTGVGVANAYVQPGSLGSSSENLLLPRSLSNSEMASDDAFKVSYASTPTDIGAGGHRLSVEVPTDTGDYDVVTGIDAVELSDEGEAPGDFNVKRRFNGRTKPPAYVRAHTHGSPSASDLATLQEQYTLCISPDGASSGSYSSSNVSTSYGGTSSRRLGGSPRAPAPLKQSRSASALPSLGSSDKSASREKKSRRNGSVSARVSPRVLRSQSDSHYGKAAASSVTSSAASSAAAHCGKAAASSPSSSSSGASGSRVPPAVFLARLRKKQTDEHTRKWKKGSATGAKRSNGFDDVVSALEVIGETPPHSPQASLSARRRSSAIPAVSKIWHETTTSSSRGESGESGEAAEASKRGGDTKKAVQEAQGEVETSVDTTESGSSKGGQVTLSESERQLSGGGVSTKESCRLSESLHGKTPESSANRKGVSSDSGATAGEGEAVTNGGEAVAKSSKVDDADTERSAAKPPKVDDADIDRNAAKASKADDADAEESSAKAPKADDAEASAKLQGADVSEKDFVEEEIEKPEPAAASSTAPTPRRGTHTRTPTRTADPIDSGTKHLPDISQFEAMRNVLMTLSKHLESDETHKKLDAELARLAGTIHEQTDFERLTKHIFSDDSAVFPPAGEPKTLRLLKAITQNVIFPPMFRFHTTMLKGQQMKDVRDTGGWIVLVNFSQVVSITHRRWMQSLHPPTSPKYHKVRWEIKLTFTDELNDLKSVMLRSLKLECHKDMPVDAKRQLERDLLGGQVIL